MKINDDVIEISDPSEINVNNNENSKVKYKKKENCAYCLKLHD